MMDSRLTNYRFSHYSSFSPGSLYNPINPPPLRKTSTAPMSASLAFGAAQNWIALCGTKTGVGSLINSSCYLSGFHRGVADTCTCVPAQVAS